MVGIRSWFKPNQRIVYSDGAIRPDRNLSGLGAIVMDNDRNILHWWCTRAGPMTNNEAEYAAAIFALEQMRRFQPSEIKVFSDNILRINLPIG